MTDQPTVSVVLPTRNGSRFLDQAIRSCLSQTLRAIELIAVDDGSTDATAAILDRAAQEDPRLQIVRHPASRGLPASLNAGFARARGPYLTWTSDDNWYRPAALERMVAFLEAQPGCDLVYADHTVRDERGEEGSREEMRRCEPPDRITEVNVVQACFLFRRALLESVGRWDESLACAEDYDYWLRAQAAGFRLAPLHEDLYVYRLHGASLTATRREEVRRRTFATLERHLPDLRGVSRRQRALGHLRLAEYAREEGDLAAFRRHFLRALIGSPAVPMRRRRTGRAPALNFVSLLFGFGVTERIRAARRPAARR